MPRNRTYTFLPQDFVSTRAGSKAYTTMFMAALFIDAKNTVVHQQQNE